MSRSGRGRRLELIRPHSSFPWGPPGAGLLLLRVAAGVYLLGHGASHLVAGQTPSRATVAFVALEAASGLLLIAGSLVPAAGVLAAGCGVANAFSWLPAAPLRLFDDPVAAGCVAVMAAAVVLLGPGAYSLDARLFGRREIIIPRADRASRP